MTPGAVCASLSGLFSTGLGSPTTRHGRRMRLRSVASLAVFALVACEPPVDPTSDAGPEPLPAECTGPSPKSIFGRVVNGETEPTTYEIDDAQQLAVGALLYESGWGLSNVCTATLIASNLVVTAAHCVHDERSDSALPAERLHFGIGPDMRWPHATFQVARVVYQREYHPNSRFLAHYDIAILQLAGDATEYPGLRPIRLNDEPLPAELVGTPLQAVGYGLTSESDHFNTRKHWTTLDLTAVDGRELVVYGRGRTSVCFGDSGGPLLLRFPDGELRIIGIASWVAGSCLSRNHYCRVDANMAWIELPEIAGSLDCGHLPGFGVCDGTTRRWCEGGAPKSAACGPLEFCEGGIDTPLTCVPDPCRGLNWQGACEDGVAVWCESGRVRSFDCGACGRSCDWVGAGVGYFCK